MVAITKYRTPRAWQNREERSNDAVRAHDPRILPGLPLARIAHAKERRASMEGASLAEAAAFLGYRRLADSLNDDARNEREAQTANPNGVAMGSAMSGGDATAGGTLLSTDVQRGFIDSLEHQVAVRSLIPPERVILSRSPTAQIPSVETAPVAEMVGENPAAGNPQALGTGVRTLNAHKMRVEIVLSRDIVRGALNADVIIYGEIARAAAALEDRLLVEGKGAELEFRGLKVLAEGRLAAMSASPDYHKARKDLRSMLKAMADNHVPDAAGRAFVGAEQHRWGLGEFETPTGDRFPFSDSLESNRLLGRPAAFSTALATDCFYCFAPGEALYFEQLAMGIEADTTFTDTGGTMYSASAADQVVFRLFRGIDFAMAHAEAVEYLDGITWGAP